MNEKSPFLVWTILAAMAIIVALSILGAVHAAETGGPARVIDGDTIEMAGAICA